MKDTASTSQCDTVVANSEGTDRVASLLDRAGLPLARKRYHFGAGDIIYREAGEAQALYSIRRGVVKLVQVLADGRERIIRLQSKNSWIGLDGLMECPYQHTAFAIDEVEVCSYSTRRLLDIKAQKPEYFLRFMDKYYADLRLADHWIAGFSTGTIKPRVARLVAFLSDLTGGDAADKVELLSVQDMADVLGVTPESVSRVLAGFKRSGLLTSADDEVYRIDRPRLRDLCSD